MTPVEVTKLFAFLAPFYPRQELQDATTEAFAWALREEPFDAVMLRAQAHVRRSQFFPAVSELIGEEDMRRWTALGQARELAAWQERWEEVRYLSPAHREDQEQVKLAQPKVPDEVAEALALTGLASPRLFLECWGALSRQASFNRELQAARTRELPGASS